MPSVLNDDMNQNIAVPCSEYSFDLLADIYNQARVDYIVPMPMNGKRMQEYINNYSIDLKASRVALDRSDYQPNGIAMLGVRGNRSWITRLGVIPERRRRKTGEFLMNNLLQVSREQDIKLVQLEVIVGNDPAKALFEKCGFVVTRELLIIRRPPAKTDPQGVLPAEVIMTQFEDEASLHACLSTRDDQPSWLEETESLFNAGALRGISVQLPTGETGWVVFQRTPFQLTHFVFSPHITVEMARVLLGQLHALYPLQDTKIENVPLDHPVNPVFEEFGYFETFRRYEMVLSL